MTATHLNISKAGDVTKVMLKIDKLIFLDDLIYPLRPHSIMIHVLIYSYVFVTCID